MGWGAGVNYNSPKITAWDLYYCNHRGFIRFQVGGHLLLQICLDLTSLSQKLP